MPPTNVRVPLPDVHRLSGGGSSGIRPTLVRMTTNPTPWEPPLAGTEPEQLLGALERLRATFRWKTDDLDAEGLSTTIGPSRLTLGGLLKHLAANEDFASTV